MTQRIGFVGVGRMGANMARRLKDCGFAVSAVLDQSPQVAAALAEELGSMACSLLAEVTRRSDVVITVVSDDAAMREIYYQPGDNLFMDAKGKVFINCATISPAVHIELSEKAAELGAGAVEAPMASSIPQAREGKLFLMCAGDLDTIESVRGVLDSMASTVVFTGNPGTAATMKLLVNMVMNINTAALAEGLGLADAAGLDLDMVRKVFAQTGANSRVLETDSEDMQNREHETYFSAAHAAKDSRLAAELGKSLGLPMILANTTKEQYEEMIRRGLGEIDKSGVSELTFKDRLQSPLEASR